MQPSDEWDTIVRLLRRYALHKYGGDAVAITIHLSHRADHREPFPPRHVQDLAVQVAASAASTRPVWGTGPDPKHTPDYRCVYWPELGVYYLSEPQARVVEKLWKARDEGMPGVRGEVLLRESGSAGARLVDVFKGQSAWKTLIVSPALGLYSLPPAAPENAAEGVDNVEAEE